MQPGSVGDGCNQTRELLTGYGSDVGKRYQYHCWHSLVARPFYTRQTGIQN